MILSYAVVQRGNLYPEVYNCLHSLPDIALQHSNHGLRHPIGIYSISLHRVTQAFQNVLAEHNKAYYVPLKEDGSIDFDTAPLLKAQQELLDALMAHIDDGYQILKALYPASRLTKPVLFADKWLEQAKHPTVARFKQLIKPYRDTFAPIVNRIKHEHGLLPFLFFFDEVSKLTPTVGLSSDHQGVELTLNDTSQIKATSLLRWKVQIEYTGDSVTRSWTMPYMG